MKVVRLKMNQTHTAEEINKNNGTLDWLKRSVYRIPPRDILSVVGLIMYSLVGTLVYYALEGNTPLRLFPNIDSENCVGLYGFWGAMHLAATVFTSIGYGNVYPCTAGGRLFTTIYGLFGFPVMFFALRTIGKIMMNIALAIRRQVLRLHAYWMSRDRITPIIQLVYLKEVPESLKIEREIAKDDEEEVAASLGVVAAAVWIIPCVLYYSLLEGWPILESYYFTMVSLATVGLGDFAPSPSHFYLTLVNFTVLFIGLSLVSMTINLIQRNNRLYADRMHKKIQRLFKERLRRGGTEVIDEVAFMSEVRKNAGITGRIFGSKKMWRDIEHELRATARLVSKFVQATGLKQDGFSEPREIRSAEFADQCTPEQIDKPNLPTPPGSPVPWPRSQGVQVDIAQSSLATVWRSYQSVATDGSSQHTRSQRTPSPADEPDDDRRFDIQVRTSSPFFRSGRRPWMPV